MVGILQQMKRFKVDIFEAGTYLLLRLTTTLSALRMEFSWFRQTLLSEKFSRIASDAAAQRILKRGILSEFMTDD
jgi:hypothetical protein